MSSPVLVVVVVLVVALAAAALVGVLLNRRSGRLKAIPLVRVPVYDPAELGLSSTGPTVLHFSATWCGPCAAVRRVVDQVCDDLVGVAHVEIDMDANPEAARRLSVLSLPTTFIFAPDGRQLYRTAGVPKAADLRAALEPLLA
jgi:thiol-disulfide isomerase/thioredoxin